MGKGYNFCKGDDRKLYNLCKNGNIIPAKSIYVKMENPNINHIYRCFDITCTNGHLELAKWLYCLIDKNSPNYNKENLHKIHSKAFAHACINSKLEMAKWLFNLDDIKPDIHYGVDYIFRYLCEKNNFIMLLWLMSLDEKPNIHANDEEALRNACYNGNFLMVKWLFSFDDKPNINIFYDMFWYRDIIQPPFNIAILKKNYDIAKWMMTLDVKPNIHGNNDAAFKYVCYYEDLEMAKWLMSLDGEINIHYDDDYNFRNLCQKGNLEMVKWMMTLDDKPDIHAVDDLAFRNACVEGHLEIAKWLYLLDGEINFHYANENTFIYTCKKGHLEIAKWLYSLDGLINIRAENDEAFRNACEKDYIEIVKWLITLCDDYNAIIEDDMVTNWSIKNRLKDMLINKEYDKIIEKMGIQKKYFELVADNICSICYESKYNFLTSCNHTFCFDCFLLWYVEHNNDTCSYCRKKIDLKMCILNI